MNTTKSYGTDTYTRYPFSYSFVLRRKSYSDYTDKYSLRNIVKNLGGQLFAVSIAHDTLNYRCVVLSPTKLLNQLKELKVLEGIEIQECCHFGEDRDLDLNALIKDVENQRVTTWRSRHVLTDEDREYWGD